MRSFSRFGKHQYNNNKKKNINYMLEHTHQSNALYFLLIVLRALQSRI